MFDDAYQTRGRRKRQKIIEATALLLRESGPGSVTHRSVASRAGVSLSATTYYFSGLDELLEEAARLNIQSWVQRVRHTWNGIVEKEPPENEREAAEILIRACLPKDIPLDNHYRQLIAVGTSNVVKKAYRAGRIELDAALEKVIEHIGVDIPAQVVIGIVDGAAVAAISEGRDIRETAMNLLIQVLNFKSDDEHNGLQEVGGKAVAARL
ncbi:transcriptional regulator BetI [Corynebacterium kutscheri]|uniref:Transcriptional regulator BetI n=1 Tax=Corynebacterium kutscheri TaxID=35755 RepID=A0A0F6R0D8_9CORY|nr:TetR family transcriptional regulator [Corynebacterium kutscheri]AKE40348.1 transcriptional regulator, TetR family [Corynebacterium kutscheri]VEH05384.1 transcriptional regulator BetI [Corynebacterium kutscheri]VEH10742.1 transcriptional regulator BetI [Corynebacterium kutscheri]VEH80778.1 transcriptional regulator BetI [Corynebacterium kutscheri]